MRVLIDECVDPRVKRLLRAHQAATILGLGWGKLPDREILTRARDQFDVLVTADKSIEFQQNLTKYGLGLVVVHVRRNHIAHYHEVEADLLTAIESVAPGRVFHVWSKR